MTVKEIDMLLLQEMEEIRGGFADGTVCECNTGAKRGKDNTGECKCSSKAQLADDGSSEEEPPKCTCSKGGAAVG